MLVRRRRLCHLWLRKRSQSDKSAPVETPVPPGAKPRNVPPVARRSSRSPCACRYCGTEFDTVDPLSLKDLRKQVKKGERLRSTRTLVVVLFIFAIVGCLAPIVAVVSTVYVLMQRDVIVKAGPSYLVMAYSAMGISYLYSILMVLFVLFSLASR